jgi:hypothetical protein
MSHVASFLYDYIYQEQQFFVLHNNTTITQKINHENVLSLSVLRPLMCFQVVRIIHVSCLTSDDS